MRSLDRGADREALRPPRAGGCMIIQPGNGFTIWLTGMQGAGKRTLARALAERLRRLERPVEFFEGPEWEQFIGPGPGETLEERNALIRRAGFVAKAIT